MSRLLIGLMIVAGFGMHLTGNSAAEDQPAAKEKTHPAAAAAPTQAMLEKDLAKKLSGCVFAGYFSVTGKDAKPPTMEKYTIAKVTKLKDDNWLFEAKMGAAKDSLTIPMILPIKWAGDTPVITLTDLTIPKMGTFTSRVVIYGDRYAGTWQHGATGGHLWGMIEKSEPIIEEKK